MTDARKKYIASLLIAMGSFAGMLIGINTYLGNHPEASQLEQTILALFPMLPVLLLVKAVLNYAQSWDELQRRKAMEAMLVSFFITGFGTFGYGFLEGVGFPPLDSTWIMPAMIWIYVIAKFFVGRRYQ